MTNRFDPRASVSTRQRGFTLIEMLIVVAVVAMLAGIAYPGYQRYTQNALRADAKSGLLNAAAELERCYARSYRYADCPVTNTSPEGHYALELAEGEGGFLLTATTLENDGCDGPLTLDALGVRRPESCW